MKVSPEFKWLIPYIKEGLRILGKDVTVTRLQAIRYSVKNIPRPLALIVTDDDIEFRIYLKTFHFPRHLKTPGKLSRIDFINNLSHELGHIEDWEHTPKHGIAESRIRKRLMEMLRDSGYISEEDELK